LYEKTQTEMFVKRVFLLKAKRKILLEKDNYRTY